MKAEHTGPGTYLFRFDKPVPTASFTAHVDLGALGANVFPAANVDPQIDYRLYPSIERHVEGDLTTGITVRIEKGPTREDLWHNMQTGTKSLSEPFDAPFTLLINEINPRSQSDRPGIWTVGGRVNIRTLLKCAADGTILESYCS